MGRRARKKVSDIEIVSQKRSIGKGMIMNIALKVSRGGRKSRKKARKRGGGEGKKNGPREFEMTTQRGVIR